MADPLDKTISELPVDASLDGSEIVPVVQNGNKRTTAGAIAALAPGTDLSYDPATRILSSSTGADAAPLPVVSSTVAGLVPPGWVSGAEAATLPHIHGNLAGILYEHVRNDSGAAMAALMPYHVVGSQGDTDRVLIVPADPGTPGSMPASGILPLPLTANQDGHGALGGVLTGVNTAAWPSGTVLYVAVGGGLTDQPPAAGAQSVAIVGRSHATTGTLALLSSPSLARVAFTGAYGDLLGLPTLGTAAAADTGDFATPAQGAKADSAVQPSALIDYVQTTDSRLTDEREWSAATVPQAEAEEGIATTRRAWTAQRVRQATASWWTGASTAAGRVLVTAENVAAQRTVLGVAPKRGIPAGALITSPGITVLTTQGAVAGQVRYGSPIYLDDTYAPLQLLARTSSGHTGTSTIQLGIYALSATTYAPGDLLFASSVVTADAANTNYGVSFSGQMFSGWIILAFLLVSASGSPQFQGTGTNTISFGAPFFTATNTGGQLISSWMQGGTSLPATANPTALTGTPLPVAFLLF